MESWKEIAGLGDARTRLNGITWPYDKYPDMPQLLAGTAVVLIDAEGPGVVTNIHVSDYMPLQILFGDQRPADPKAAAQLIVRVFYDNEEKPSINMPLYDFLGDVGGESAYYGTVFFSKVKRSHNFRLPLPFDNHIKIEIQNTTDTDLLGYCDIQWDQTDALPNRVGYLYAEYRRGEAVLPETVLDLADIKGKGKIAAHWYSVSADIPEAANGEYLCEGNQEFYIDGCEKAALEYLGSEDCYGYSWGFADTNSDHYAAIIKKLALPGGGSDIAMLRCRTADAISFETGCKVKVDYTADYFTPGTSNPWHNTPVFAARKRFSFTATYSACTYYYKKPC